jgi:DinB superfamily
MSIVRDLQDKPANMDSTLNGRPVSPNIVELCEEMASINAAAIETCEGLNDEQLTWVPCLRKWSVAQNFAHLRTTTEVFLPAVDEALKTCRTSRLHSDGPFLLTPYGRLLVWRMDARPLIKMNSPKAIWPHVLDAPGQELDHFLLSQAAMKERVESAEGLHLTALRFPSPLAKYMRVNLLEFFSMFNAHSRRHLWQARRVRDALCKHAKTN